MGPSASQASEGRPLVRPGRHDPPGGERGGNVRLAWRGRASPRRPRRLGSSGRRAPSRDRTVRPGGGEGRPIARREGCPTRVLALGARLQGQRDGPPEVAREGSVSERSASLRGSRSSGASSRGPASSRSVSSTGVSVGSVPSRVAPGSSTSSGGTSARASRPLGSGSSSEDDGSSSSSDPSPGSAQGRPSTASTKGAMGSIASGLSRHPSARGALPSAAEVASIVPGHAAVSSSVSTADKGPDSTSPVGSPSGPSTGSKAESGVLDRPFEGIEFFGRGFGPGFRFDARGRLVVGLAIIPIGGVAPLGFEALRRGQGLDRGPHPRVGAGLARRIVGGFDPDELAGRDLDPGRLGRFRQGLRLLHPPLAAPGPGGLRRGGSAPNRLPEARASPGLRGGIGVVEAFGRASRPEVIRRFRPFGGRSPWGRPVEGERSKAIRIR